MVSQSYFGGEIFQICQVEYNFSFKQWRILSSFATGDKHRISNSYPKKVFSVSVLSVSISLLIFIALTNRVINKVTGALVTISIGRTVIGI